MSDTKQNEELEVKQQEKPKKGVVRRVGGWLKWSFIDSNVEIVKNSSSSQSVKQNYDYLKDLTLKGIRSIKKEEEGEELSFWEAMNKYGVDNLVEIENAYKTSARKCYITLGLAVLFLLIGLYYLFIYDKWQGAVTTGALSFLMVTMAFSESVACFRFKRQEMSSISEWRAAKAFFPSLNIDLASDEDRKRYAEKMHRVQQNKKK